MTTKQIKELVKMADLALDQLQELLDSIIIRRKKMTTTLYAIPKVKTKLTLQELEKLGLTAVAVIAADGSLQAIQPTPTPRVWMFDGVRMPHRVLRCKQ